jgi:hypothetical protein
MLDSPSDSREPEADLDVGLEEIQQKLRRLHAELGARQKVDPGVDVESEPGPPAQSSDD